MSKFLPDRGKLEHQIFGGRGPVWSLEGGYLWLYIGYIIYIVVMNPEPHC